MSFYAAIRDASSFGNKDNDNNNNGVGKSSSEAAAASTTPKTLLGKRRRESLNGMDQEEDNVASSLQPLVLPFAPTLADFLAQGGPKRYRPRPEWIHPQPPSPDQESLVIRMQYPPHDTDPPLHFAAARRMEEEERVVRQQQREGRFSAEDLERHMAQFERDARNEERARQALLHMNSPSSTPPPPPSTYSPSPALAEPALLLAIRENATEAALALLDAGASVSLENSKGVSPLVLAAQKGNYTVVQALLYHGADPTSVASSGSTALLQAAHFGHRRICQLLLQSQQLEHMGKAVMRSSVGPPLQELANLNLTTPLMRAAQEGHLGVVLDLLRAGAQVNRRNRCHMSALMLASQRGHAAVCKALIQYGAYVDARTNQDSTSLLLACKRAHVQVVELLVTAGCEIHVKDARGRTARDVVLRRQEMWAARNNNTAINEEEADTQARIKAMLGLLDSTVQRHLMQHQGRQRRSWQIMLHWHLLQQDRAVVATPLCAAEQKPITLQDIPALLSDPHAGTTSLPYPLGLVSTQALLRTMLLPAPLVQLIASFLPLPHLWEQTIGMLTRRATIHADETVISALDLMDEVLEEGGFVEACDAALVPPPTHFKSWREWKAFGRKQGHVKSESSNTSSSRERPNVTVTSMPNPVNLERLTLVERRRVAGYVSLLQQHTSLQRVLLAPPYHMQPGMVSQLARTADLASLVRRIGPSGGVHFDSTVAMDLVMLVSRLCGWYWRSSESLVLPTFFRVLGEGGALAGME